MLTPVAAGVTHRFEVSALILGGLLALAALAGGRLRRGPLTLPALLLIVGFALGDGGLRLVRFHAADGFVSQLATVALIVILLRDGLEVDGEMLQAHWSLPLRKLVLAMPITAGLVAVLCHALVGLTWTESFLLGALLSPTDPVLSSSVVTNPRVPRVVRHSLNLESGLNDGLALPAVLALSEALNPGHGGFVVWRYVAENLGFGFGVGALVGYLAARAAVLVAGADGGAAPRRSLYTLGTGFAAYGIAVLLPDGNGLIAVFVAAITLGVLRPALRDGYAQEAAGLVELVKLGIFVVFGTLLTWHVLFADGVAAVAVAVLTLCLARPVAVLASLLGTRTDVATRAFMGWFGPKGVATMTFSLIVLAPGIEAGPRIFGLAALAVVVSVLVHGATDAAGADWIGRHAEAVEVDASADR